jgi:hypothetical protein
MSKEDEFIRLLTQILKVTAIQAASNLSVTGGARRTRVFQY